MDPDKVMREAVVTKESREAGGMSRTAPERRTWETMSVTRIGKFGDVLRGGSGTKGDGPVGKRVG